MSGSHNQSRVGISIAPPEVHLVRKAAFEAYPGSQELVGPPRGTRMRPAGLQNQVAGSLPLAHRIESFT
jgi:hypothetical protein